ncbi:hypothetical protein CANCADRAFT_42484 [Tortispora caseinolytica NRRL Y-17796]|uniref:Uncharacterized protein n=1 Tax=Tortispora caseinolytica NRRL Y-17796 TaxID=767744 RepID=A0A1E4TJ98_9ASCO|nr:hypothetical protein CANCADRAFT_42484 [Tortispora caseinolytica NRRL Y-17796]
MTKYQESFSAQIKVDFGESISVKGSSNELLPVQSSSTSASLNIQSTSGSLSFDQLSFSSANATIIPDSRTCSALYHPEDEIFAADDMKVLYSKMQERQIPDQGFSYSGAISSSDTTGGGPVIINMKAGYWHPVRIVNIATRDYYDAAIHKVAITVDFGISISVKGSTSGGAPP